MSGCDDERRACAYCGSTTAIVYDAVYDAWTCLNRRACESRVRARAAQRAAERRERGEGR